MAQAVSHQNPTATPANAPKPPRNGAGTHITRPGGAEKSTETLLSGKTVAGTPETAGNGGLEPKPQPQISIPRDSFTAFRLAYSTPEELSVLSSTVFLGPVPDVWAQPPETTLLFAPKATRRSMRSWIRSTGSRIRGSLSASGGIARPGLADELDPQAELQDRLAQILYSSTSSSSVSVSSRPEAGVDRPLFQASGGSDRSESESESETPKDPSRSSEGQCSDLDNRSPAVSEIGFSLRGQWPRGSEPVAVIHSSNSSGGSSGMSQYVKEHRKQKTKEEEAREVVHRFELDARGLAKSAGSDSKAADERGPIALGIAESALETEKGEECGLELAKGKSYPGIERLDFENGRTDLESAGNDREPAGNDPELAGNDPEVAENDREPAGKDPEPAGNHPEPAGKDPEPAGNHPEPAENHLEPAEIDLESVLSSHGLGASPNRSQSRAVAFADPRPEDNHDHDRLRNEYVRAERKHRRSVRKLHSLASASKGKARAQGSRLKLNFRRLLKERRVGEIVRVHRMLVLVKKSPAAAASFGPDSDAYVKDHWREYYVVLRKTNSFSEPLVAQYFDARKGSNFDGVPDHSFNVRKGVRVEFYSHSDKTLSVVDPAGDGTRVFIMNARYPTVAYTWMYLVKEILEEAFYPMAIVYLAESTIHMKIGIPRALVLEAFASPQHLLVTEQPHGYRAESDPLLAFLQREMDKRLRAVGRRSAQLNAWRARNPDPGFCFKFYDRVEWVGDSSAAFIVRSQILQGVVPLEYRQKARAPMHVRAPGEDLARPLAVEGFLSRITTLAGKPYGHLRPFYKISYFSTAGHLLFFSKFMAGTPPSPANALLEDACDRTAVCGALPHVYVKNDFGVDAAAHVPWLRDPAFAAMDRLAVEEFSRKVQQIVAAEAMVDLLSVVEVRPAPPHAVHARQQYFQAFLWHSLAKPAEAAELADACFEIATQNGSVLRFLAPSRSARDEWVARLRATVRFWRGAAQHATRSLVATRQENRRRFNMDEASYNGVLRANGMEFRRAVPNARLFTNAAVAMSTVVLHSGYLYQKQKKHSNFAQFYVVLCPGYVVIYSLHKRSKVSGVWKCTPYFERYLTIPVSECYVHTDASTQAELVGTRHAGGGDENTLPRLYPDGWMSAEEDGARCFTLWFGGARALKRDDARNPSLAHMVRKVGVTGKILVFLARSRQERESWVYHILQETNRFA